MHFEFEHLGTPTPFELPEGLHRLGGGTDDAIHIEGLPPGLLTLHIEGSRLRVEASRTFTVNDVEVPPGVPRLVLPGEVVGLPEEMSLRVLAPHAEDARQVGTVAVLKHLFSDAEAQPPSRAATLTCLTGDDVGRAFTLAEARTDLGRGTEASVRLRDPAVSRRHARVLHQEGTFLLEDLGSPNGVYLNGNRVEAASALKEGDVIELGRTLLRFQAPVEEPSPSPTAPKPPAPEPLTSPETPIRRPRGDEAWLLGVGAGMALLGLILAGWLMR
jgi:hypothetical protein